MGAKAFDFDGDYGANYDTFIRQVIPGYEAMHALSGAMLEPACGPRGRVLVVGCGTGSEIRILGKIHPGWTFTGLDPSEAMITSTRAALGTNGMGERVTLVKGTISDLPKAPSFDAATCMLVSHFIRDEKEKTKLFHEIGSRLAPGGRLVVADACDESSQSFRDMMACRWMFARTQGADPERYWRFQEECNSSLNSIDPTREQELIRLAGFGTVRKFWTSLHINAWFATNFKEPSAPA